MALTKGQVFALFMLAGAVVTCIGAGISLYFEFTELEAKKLRLAKQEKKMKQWVKRQL